MMRKDDSEILQAALVGYQQQLAGVTAKIEELKRRVGAGSASPRTVAARAPQKKKHRISAAGRARIAAAQRKRWAASKKSSS